MFYTASKVLWVLIQPSNLLVFVIAAGVLALLLGRQRLARWLLYPGAAAMLLVGGLPVGQWLLTPLENRFPAPVRLPDEVDGIIELSGAVDLPPAEGRGVVAFGEESERSITMLELAERYPDAKLVYTGGHAGEAFGTALSEADVMREFARRHGLDGRVIFEDRARNTYENALLSKPLAAPRPGELWLLITSAWHMPRAVGVFRRVGWPVIAYPVDYRTSGEIGLLAHPDAAQNWAVFDLAVRNWIGLAVYWLSDRTDAPFPAP
jgi:uncharacterized SAM-binding protein YcdF (DUF218 family)